MLAALDRFNARHPWSHNDLYTPLVLLHARRLRRAGGTLAVDVGCGTGHLLRSLAPVMPEVHGIEADAPTAATAAAALADLPHVVVEHAPFTTLPERSADLVTLVAVLHHLPLDTALQAVRSALRPRGRLVVVGAYREVAADRPLSLLSLVLNPFIGLLRHPRTASAPPQHMTAPTKAPAETFDEVASVMRQELPGVRIHRALFWRYVAVWTAPQLGGERIGR